MLAVMSTVVRKSFLNIIAGNIAQETAASGVTLLRIALTIVQATMTADGLRLAKDGVLGTLRVDAQRPVTKKL